MNNEFISITPPIYSISFYVDKENDEVIIFHKEQNSLIKFSLITHKTNEEISNAVYKELSHLDWDKDFDEIMKTEKYRKALCAAMAVICLEDF